MRSFDTVLTGLILWGIGIIGLFWIIPSVSVQLSSNQTYITISILLIGTSLTIIATYYLLYRNEKKRIFQELISLRKIGIQVFLDKYELLLYGRDAGDIPRISKLAFNHSARAIVQPNNLEELRKIVTLCVKYKIPLIPRAAGTSGYGGVLPVVSGIIVNLREFNKVLSINKIEKTIIVESGVIWAKLLWILEKEGLTLPCYPSSSLSSTVGGWVSQGGLGIGSSKYGSLRNHIIFVTLIGTNGKEVSLHDPDDIVGSYGSLGIILRIKLRVIATSKMKHLAVTTGQETALFKVAHAFQALTPYFLRFIDYRNLKISTPTPLGILEETPQPMSGGVLSITFREEDWNPTNIEEIIERHNLTLLSEEWGNELWEDRFYTLRMKRTGPSLIIAEVNVPTDRLVAVFEMLNRRFDPQRFTKEFITNNGDHTTVMLWFPDDSRKATIPRLGSITYMFRSLRPYIVFQIARRYGAVAYSTGLWFSPYSKAVLGPKLARFRELKKQFDPDKIFNPGKIWAPYFPRFFPIIPYSIMIRVLVPILSVLHRILPKKLK